MDTNDSQPTNQPLGRPLGMPPGTDEEQPMPKSRTITDPDEKQAAPQPTPTTPKTNKPQGASKRTWLIALIALLLAGGIGGGIYYFLSQKDSRTLDDDEEDMEMVDEDTDEDDMDDEDIDEDDTYVIEEKVEEEEEAEEEVAPQPTNRKLNLSGDADGYPLTLSLEITPDNRVSGTFNNETTGSTIQVSGSSSNGAIRLTGRGDRTTYTFRIVPEGHIYTGTLTKGNSKSQELHLVGR